MRAQGKVVVITGASMGIGEAVAQIFVREGANVVLSSRELARVEAARQRIGSTERTLAAACDVRQRASIDKLVQTTVGQFGRIDVWVNNAGYGLLDTVAEMDMQRCRELFDTNLFGTIECMQAVVPQMKKQEGGAIINIASVAGHIAVPSMAAYCASKSAMLAISRAARIELKKDNINVMGVCPGYVETNFSVNAVKGENAQRLSAAGKNRITGDRVAEATFKGYLKKTREVVVPWNDWPIIWFYRLLPGLVDHAMGKMLRPADQVIAQQQAAARKN